MEDIEELLNSISASVFPPPTFKETVDSEIAKFISEPKINEQGPEDDDLAMA
jgi:hypothetical protein